MGKHAYKGMFASLVSLDHPLLFNLDLPALSRYTQNGQSLHCGQEEGTASIQEVQGS